MGVGFLLVENPDALKKPIAVELIDLGAVERFWIVIGARVKAQVARHLVDVGLIGDDLE
jgi:hypothetical protein